MTDIQAFEAWAKGKPLEVFWSFEAWQAATLAERERCRLLAVQYEGSILLIKIRTGEQP